MKLEEQQAQDKLKNSNLRNLEKRKIPETVRFQGFSMVDDTGLEPVTSRTSSGCSYQLS